MTDTTQTAPPAWLKIAGWTLQGLLALAFLAAAAMKLTGQPKMVAEFADLPLGQTLRYITGAIEVTGAALLLWPRTALLGAATLLCVDVGALGAQIVFLHGDLIHVCVLGGLLALSAWMTRRAG